MSADVSAVERIERRLAAHARFDEPWDKGYLQGLRDGLYDVKEADCTARAVLAAVAALADEWVGYGHGEFCVHVDDPGCQACKIVVDIRAALDGAAADPAAATEGEQG